jgi:hypothetical protein
VVRLWNWWWGLIALLTLILIWHIPNAPHFVWLNLLASVALLRVLPPTDEHSGKVRLHQTLKLYYRLSLVALLLIAVPFMIDQMRTGLYPQLQRPSQTLPQPAVAPVATRSVPPLPEGALREAEEARGDQFLARAKREASPHYHEPAEKVLIDVDPKARVQTGPWLPTWRWSAVHLAWNGPVSRDQRLAVWLIPPAGNLALNGLRVGSVVLLGLLLAGLMGRWRPSKSLGVGFLALVLIGPGYLPERAQAASFPPPELLETLETRLLEPPECLPACAAIPRLAVETDPDRLTLRLELAAQTDVSLPLPVDLLAWRPQQVLFDGQLADGLIRSSDGSLWIRAPAGVHQLLLGGALPGRERITLPLPLRPHHVEVSGEGWHVERVGENGVPGNQLQLIRLDAGTDQAASQFAASTLPPLLRIERTLRLGLDRRVETQVVRLSPADVSVLVRVPLLTGESVTTEGVRVEGNEVLVSLRSGQRNLTWRSTLIPLSPLVLTASPAIDFIETWRADPSPIWHVQLAGIPVVHHQDKAQHWLPEWRPWPGERVILSLSRPEGLSGPTLTIDSSELRVNPGRRTTEVALALSLRSTQGGQHRIVLPEAAQLQRVAIDGRTQPFRQEGPHLTLPVVPGTQHFQLEWRQPTGIGSRFFTPPVDLGAPSVNASITIALGADRWILLLGGPALGPAVLFWGG